MAKEQFLGRHVGPRPEDVEDVSVGLNINNLFDENYTEKDGYNMPGRNFQVRAAMTF